MAGKIFTANTNQSPRRLFKQLIIKLIIVLQVLLIQESAEFNTRKLVPLRVLIKY